MVDSDKSNQKCNQYTSRTGSVLTATIDGVLYKSHADELLGSDNVLKTRAARLQSSSLMEKEEISNCKFNKPIIPRGVQ